MSGVTKVLQSVGVNCCTVQPEFISCSGSSSCEASAVAHIEDSSLPCLLACKKACAEFMCCSSLREETQTLPPPSAKESTEEPQPLILRNALMMENEWIMYDKCLTAVKGGNDRCRLSSQNIWMSLLKCWTKDFVQFKCIDYNITTRRWNKLDVILHW